MGKLKSYFSGKLFDINYRIAVHEGDANHRLASEAIKIKWLPSSEVPLKYKKKYDMLIALITNTIKGLPAPGLKPTRLRGIRNATAAKYIKMLIDIQYSLSDD